MPCTALLHAFVLFPYRFPFLAYALLLDAMSLFLEPRYTATSSFQDTDESTLDYAEVHMGVIVSPY